LRSIFTLPAVAIVAAALVAARPAGRAPEHTGAQCDPARDQRILDVVAAEIRTGLAGRANEAEIRARVASAHERLRASGALTCSGSTAAVPVGEFGAIAVNASLAWGVSWDHRTQAEADARARSECPGAGCRVVVRIVGPACGAYATNGSAYGWGTDVTREAAEARALSECSAQGRRCRVLAYACNTR